MKAIRDYDASKRFQAKVLGSRRITPESSQEEVRHIVLEVSLDASDFEGYESVGVLLRGPKDLGSPLFHRLYTIAGITDGGPGSRPAIELCVRRCFYVDDFNGQRYPGAVSNYLCDLQPGQELEFTGPFGAAFPTPGDPKANLVMICQGTGIAPFRALVDRIYREFGEWQGKVRLFHGAHTGLELLYMNDENADFALYYEKKTFKAIEALSPRPHFGAPAALDRALEDNAAELWEMLQDPSTHVYIAGLEKMSPQLDAAFRKVAGSDEAWEQRKAELIEAEHWFELLY